MQDIEFISPFEELENGCSIEDSIVFIEGEIETGTLFKAISKIRACLKNNPEQDITIVINSEGGDESEALGLIDYIQSLPVKVNIIARGRCMSAAAILLCFATGFRGASKNTLFMLHESTITLQGTTKSNNSYLEVSNRIEKEMYEELAKRTKLTVEDWYAIDYDKYLTASDAKNLGIIDAII